MRTPNIYLSKSGLETWLSCQRKYQLTRTWETPSSPALDQGTRWDSILTDWFLGHGNLWQNAEPWRAAIASAAEAIGEIDRSYPIDAHVKFEVPSWIPELLFRGEFDVLHQAPDLVTVWEIKSTKHNPHAWIKKLHFDLQREMYHYAASRLYPRMRVRVVHSITQFPQFRSAKSDEEFRAWYAAETRSITYIDYIDPSAESSSMFVDAVDLFAYSEVGELERTGRDRPRNPTSCHAYGQTCSFYPHCAYDVDVEDLSLKRRER
jgi:hypothetical protein